MLGKIVTTEPPYVSIDSFEEQLATDDLLVHYFNDFLSLPVFYEAVTYNKENGIFEVATEAADSLTQQIRSAILECQSKLLKDQVEPPNSSMIDNSYTVLCLDREQGIQWIKRERLPLFLRSDCYFEYRLAKLLSQVDSTCIGRRLQVDATYRPWAVTSDPRPVSDPVRDEYETPPQRQTTVCSSSVDSCSALSPRSETTIDLSSPQSTSEDLYSPAENVECNRKEQAQRALEGTRVYITETKFAGPQRSMSAPQTLTVCTLEDVARSVVAQVLENAVSELKMGPPTAQEEAGSHTEALINGQPANEYAEKGKDSEGSELEDETEATDDDLGLRGVLHTKKGLQDFRSFLQGTPGEKLYHLWMDIERLQTLQSSKNRLLIRMRRQYLLSSGRCALSVEVLSRLGLASIPCWMEDKLKVAQPRITEVLLLYWWPRFCTAQSEEVAVARLKLWRDRQLRPPAGIDPSPRTVTLLPLRPASCIPRLTLSNNLQELESTSEFERCATSKQASLRPHTQGAASSCLKPLWEKPYPSSTGDFPTMHCPPMTRAPTTNKKLSLKSKSLSLSFNARAAPLDTKMTLRAVGSTQGPTPVLKPEPSSATLSNGSYSPFLGGRRMERMLQALQSEMRSGLCFTYFCESSGNQMWANSIHFWTDLQDYHQLFYQDGLDPYRVQQQAQRLYSVYLSPSARMTFGVDEDSRRQVQACLTPPFEELFDAVEEHVLTLLFQPWTLMNARDRATFEKVELWEESRHINTALYRKLKVLYRKLMRRLNQSAPERKPPPPPAEAPSEPDSWVQVPEQFRRYRLGTVLRHRLELQHFHSYLEEHFASMDLMCWLDIEQYKRLPQKDRAEREEMYRDIRSRYLSRRYFFGPNSPASREQQEEVIRMGGGWGRILQGRLMGPVLVEVQNHVRRRIEKKWLPLFLATPQFSERQKVKSQVEDVVEDLLSLRHRKKREVWKHVDSTWMASSKEILAFRRALLNPLSCRQFQCFVSLKGDFLENGVLFWLEVQRYKNLFHSHCDEASIQQKITLIINSFVNSSIPPALQIPIPLEQAQDILERRRDLGPYIFREAQMTVLSELFKLWPQFLSFKASVDEEDLLSVLEAKKEKQREEMLHQRRVEERRAQEEAEKQRSGLAEGLFEDEGSVFGGSQEDMGRESRGPTYSNKQMSWSYSKYLSALEQEQVLLQSRTHRERGVPSVSLSSRTDTSRHSIKSEGSRRSRSQRSILSARAQNIPH
ncbi:hypothetical protein GJAV_G00019550 [Gymnothorax javanicus]|nr:hypothetical protein GJAV_G00019550 [Gymnothorax javanicus]